MHRFLVTPGVLAAEPLALEGEAARQMAVVLRLRAGEEVVLFDGGGAEVRAALLAVTPRRVTLRPLERRPNRAETRAELRLFVALLRAPRFELVLQKATELGVAAITPVVARRALARPSGEGVPTRWRAIVREAAEQCGRGRLPELAAPLPFAAACAAAAAADLALCCSEHGGGDLRALLAGSMPQSLALLVGPEGGLEPGEVAAAEGAGLRPLALGPRILRAETAAIAAIAAAACLLGEWPATPAGQGDPGDTEGPPGSGRAAR